MLDLSRSGRTGIDYAVIGLVTCAILWNLFQLGRRLFRQGGAQDLWHLMRTVLFWIIGLFNTALIRPEDVGSLKNWIGWTLLVVAAIDTAFLFRKERRAMTSEAQPS